ncbi:MAG: hypothetical protein ACRC92_26935 [Peptostreptococcaceae bacterium]
MIIRLTRNEVSLCLDDDVLSKDDMLELKERFDDVSCNGAVRVIADNVKARFDKSKTMEKYNMSANLENGDESIELFECGEGEVRYEKSLEVNWTMVEQDTQLILECGDDLNLKQYTNLSKDMFIYDRLDNISEFDDRAEISTKNWNESCTLELREIKSDMSYGHSVLKIEKYTDY